MSRYIAVFDILNLELYDSIKTSDALFWPCPNHKKILSAIEKGKVSRISAHARQLVA